jgi:large subunit ribosomal protein L5
VYNLSEVPSENKPSLETPKVMPKETMSDAVLETPKVESQTEKDTKTAILTVDEDTEPEAEPVPVEEEVPEEEPEPIIRKYITTGTRSMREIKIRKVVVNITTGQSGEPLDTAMTILENLVGQKPCTRRAKQTIRTWGIRRNEPISCLVTLRGTKAEDFLIKGFSAVRNWINLRSFDTNGNFAFGISEHIDIPGQRYDPNLGITGMDVMVSMERPGYRIGQRRKAKSRVGSGHRVTREEAIEFIKQRFGVEVGLPVE